MGVAFAGNMFTLFVFYEVLTLSTYPLVTHAGTDEAKRGGRVYLGLLVGTSIGFLLLAVVWTWWLAGTLDFRQGGVLSGTASSGATPSWPEQNRMRACGGSSTPWLYWAKGARIVAGV